MEMLYEIVPVDRLDDAFRLAFKRHNTPFPINVYDLKNAYDQLCSEEAAARAESRRQDAESNPVKYCPTKHEHVNESGDVVVVIGGPGGKDVTIPCPDCRTKASDVRFAEEIEKFRRENGPAEEVSKQAFSMYLARKNRKDESDHVGQALTEIGKEIADSRDEVEREKLRNVWLKLLRIAEYIRSNGGVNLWK